ncbi:hypothetical protein [Actinacidiphila reveromycinica]|uniref:hypothetical protein n=1 Tax=Actinacidiphila reveromycinica TaxID=659352 RepID=UPI0019242D8A|nr:hypothetical protein [Streptomyces sp. SN-593]
MATAFVAAWASHQPNPGWLVRVDAYATPGFADALATVDPSRVPATRVTGTAKVTDTGATASTSAAVSTDQGVVSVSLRWDGTAWKVADVRPDAQAVE